MCSYVHDHSVFVLFLSVRVFHLLLVKISFGLFCLEMKKGICQISISLPHILRSQFDWKFQFKFIHVAPKHNSLSHRAQNSSVREKNILWNTAFGLIWDITINHEQLLLFSSPLIAVFYFNSCYIGNQKTYIWGDLLWIHTWWVAMGSCRQTVLPALWGLSEHFQSSWEATDKELFKVREHLQSCVDCHKFHNSSRK